METSNKAKGIIKFKEGFNTLVNEMNLISGAADCRDLIAKKPAVSEVSHNFPLWLPTEWSLLTWM